HVTMDLPRAVDRAQPLDELERGGAQPRIVAGRSPRRRPEALSHEADKVGPLDQLHREEALLAGHVEIVEPGQVGMREIAQSAELLLEQIELLGSGPREEPLQRDLGEQLLVPCAMDRAHCARAEMRAELIAPCAERHCRRLVPSHGRGRKHERAIVCKKLSRGQRVPTIVGGSETGCLLTTRSGTKRHLREVSFPETPTSRIRRWPSQTSLSREHPRDYSAAVPRRRH